MRSTENLWLTRTTSVYLMAEETKNEATRKLYKQHILDYTKTLYRVGIGEWDSENYHGHSIGPLLNLYDFAKDRDVKVAAKACLDFYSIAGAIKYYRGGFNGLTKVTTTTPTLRGKAQGIHSGCGTEITRPVSSITGNQTKSIK